MIIGDLVEARHSAEHDLAVVKFGSVSDARICNGDGIGLFGEVVKNGVDCITADCPDITDLDAVSRLSVRHDRTVTA